MNQITCIVFVLLFQINTFAQSNQKYWIFFKDKDVASVSNSVSNETLQKRLQQGLSLYQFTDLPLKQQYLQVLKANEIQPIVCSKWLNAASGYIAENQLVYLKSLPFVKQIIPVKSKQIALGTSPVSKTQTYNYALQMLSAEIFEQEKLTAKNVKIGVIDAGFSLSDKDSLLQHLFKNQQIVAKRDFLHKHHDSLFFKMGTDDFHGTEVLQNLAGNHPNQKEQTKGLAKDALFYLAKTENVEKEYRGEEDLWVAAMEWMDSVGVQLINTSLGYAQEMDEPLQNYQIEEMDGATTVIAKASKIAVNEKGIFLVVAAGNEGRNSKWKIVTSPADCEDVLSVGAVNGEWLKESYSSIGSSLVPFVKPDVSGFSTNGTSFSSPLIAGFVACLLQKDPYIQPKALKEIVVKSGHLSPFKNNYVGTGVPQADKAFVLLGGKDGCGGPITFTNTMQFSTKDDFIILSIDNKEIYPLIAFHKKDKYFVIEQEELKISLASPSKLDKLLKKTKKPEIKITKPEGAQYSTIQLGMSIIEVKWE